MTLEETEGDGSGDISMVWYCPRIYYYVYSLVQPQSTFMSHVGRGEELRKATGKE